jgi:thiosulfate dehydrogenase (quinone) large subunit
MAAVLFWSCPPKTGKPPLGNQWRFIHFNSPRRIPFSELTQINAEHSAWRDPWYGRNSQTRGRVRHVPNTSIEKSLILYFRFLMAWTFLYAASHQVFVPGWTVVGFLNHTKTFHDVFAVFTTPAMAPVTTFLVEYGHLLIGLSLLTGLMVRVSAAFGVLLMGIYWMAHMDWPFVENSNNLIVDYHAVYAGVLVYLIYKRAGHVFGLDAWAENLQFVKEHPALKPLVA